MNNFEFNKILTHNYSDLINYAENSDNQINKELITKFLSEINPLGRKRLIEKGNEISEIFKIIYNETGGGVNTLIGALLFTFYSDEELKNIKIEKEYNKSVQKILNGLLKVPEIKTEKVDKQADNFIKFLLTITDDVRSILILIVKQIYNIRHIELFSKKDQDIIINQVSSLYIPMAHRIGLYNIKTELEEKVMKLKEKEMYKFIAGRLQETKASRDKYIETFIAPLKKIIAEAGYKAVIKGRPKSIHSIWNKMKSQSVTFDEVYDLFAIRIILKSDYKNEKAVCWNVYSIITDLYKPNPKRLRDWVSSPKLSGYESLHTTVLGPENKWVEVQLRTERMDEIAEKGPAAHWRYKSGKEGESSDWLAQIRESLENSFEYETDKDEEKSQLYADEILVFTPEGDLKSLKKGYTVLDFAFIIHTKVGETCSGAIVNGKIQALSYELVNGDTVKILTNKNKRPNREWLEIAKGSKTKNKIKRALKSITFKHAESGKDIVKDKLDRLKVDFSEKNIEYLSEYFKTKNTIEFYNKVGEGSIDISKIKSAFDEQLNYEEKVVEDIDKEIKEKEETFHEDFLLIDENMSDLDYKLSKCCNPIPGDEIFGFITVNKGTRIHRRSCPNALDLKSRYPYRIVKAKWNLRDQLFNFSVSIFINGNDNAGISSQITDVVIKEFNLKLHAISLKTTKNSQFEGIIAVKINNKKQLEDLIKRLRLIKGINYVNKESQQV